MIDTRILISKKIKEYRAENHITQNELGRKLGVSPQAVYKWEKEICYPDITFLPALAIVVGCSINDFFE
ncbi:MAG: helix-turn-helix transcriptional regulator [Clostridia bacterium]|nr:helix-turn-helix transcriptional regulator [Clostridia bacterium]